MAADKMVVSHAELQGAPVSEQELDTALAYAHEEPPKGKYGRDLDRDLLRIIINTVIERRDAGTKLPFLTAHVVREVLPLVEKNDTLKYEAYKGATMKVFSTRSAWKRRGATRTRKAAARDSTGPPKPLEDLRPKYKGQYKLF